MVLALINAQAFVYSQLELPIAEGGYPGMFYAVTGTMIGPVPHRPRASPASPPSATSAGASTTGRSSPPTPCYWYVLATVFSAVWLIVYVTK